MKATRWIALLCSDEAQELLQNYPTAFLLLTQIAMRAKWKDCQITGLKAGEALIGDWKCAGLQSEKAYRHAKKVLHKCGLATFKGRPKGTVAALVGATIFSLSADDRGAPTGDLGADGRATKGQAEGDLGATNHKERRKDGYPDTKKNTPPAALAEECYRFSEWFKALLPEKEKHPANWREQFAKAYDEMTRLDGRTKAEIKAVCEFGTNDDFWKDHFKLPGYLRKKSKTTGAQRFDQIAAAMAKAGKPAAPQKTDLTTSKL